LKDDEAQGFSKRKYEGLNERKRRMGDKKKSIKMNKAKARENRLSGATKSIKK